MWWRGAVSRKWAGGGGVQCPGGGRGGGGHQYGTVCPEIKFFHSFRRFLRSRKKTFFGSTIVFWFKMFFHHSDPAGVAKKQFGSKTFSFKMVILLKMDHFCSFSAHFGSFWLHFGLRNVFRFKRFFLVQNAFPFKSGRSRKNILNGKTILNEKCFFLNEKAFGSKNKKPYFRKYCIYIPVSPLRG